MTLGSALAWQGRPAEAAAWIQRAERTISPETAPASAMGVQYARGQAELARGRFADALTAFRAAERLIASLRRAAPAGQADASLAGARAGAPGRPRARRAAAVRARPA